MKSEVQRDLEKKRFLGSQEIYKGQILRFTLETYQLGEKAKVAEIVHHPGAVVLLPIDSQGRILLLTRTPNS